MNRIHATPPSPRPLRATALASAAALALALGGCGGGSDSPVAPIAPPVASLTLSGTAATGAALASAAVSVKCAGGTGSATTATDGSYSATLSGATLPCVLSVTSGGTTLRSVAEAGSATTATVNLTPLSELIVARLAGGDAGTLFSTFDAAAQAKLSATALAEVRATLTTALKGVIDLTGVDPIKAALVAANGSKEGNALDKQLDALGAALKAANTSLADLGAAINANGSAPAVVQTLLQPVATSCAGLRSGKYRLLDTAMNGVDAATPLVTIDAVGLKYTDAAGTVKPLAAEGGCLFSLDSGAIKAYVAPSGAAVLRYPVSQTLSRAALLLPEQAVPVAELAGNWNILTYGSETAGTAPVPGYSTETIDATGKTTAGADCTGATCTPWTPQASDVLVPSNSGGFTMTDADGSKTRVFAFKTPAGQISLAGLMFDPQGRILGLLAAAKLRELSLPTVGQVDRFWDVEVNWNGVSTPTDVEMTIKTVDSATNSYTRQRKSDGRIDGFGVNKPRNGLRYRNPGSSVLTDGRTVTFAEATVLPLPGTGISVSSGVTATSNFFNVSVTKP